MWKVQSIRSNLLCVLASPWIIILVKLLLNLDIGDFLGRLQSLPSLTRQAQSLALIPLLLPRPYQLRQSMPTERGPFQTPRVTMPGQAVRFSSWHTVWKSFKEAHYSILREFTSFQNQNYIGLVKIKMILFFWWFWYTMPLGLFHAFFGSKAWASWNIQKIISKSLLYVRKAMKEHQSWKE